MKQQVWLSVATLAALALAGCGKSTSPLQATTGGGGVSAGNDQAQVSSVVQNNPVYVNEDLWQSPEVQPYDNPGGALAAIRPLRFWREMTLVDRSVDTQFGAPDTTNRPTMALVTVHQHFQGTFNILAGSTDPSDTSHTLVKKPLDDDWTRKILLVRLPVMGDEHETRWHLVGTSAVDVRSRGGSTTINSVRIQSGKLDTTFTDPLALHRLRRIMLVQPDAPVTLTVTTGNANDVVLFYGRDLRRRFVSNGDGTFTFQFPAGRFPGLRHFGINALSNGTLFDDKAPYDSNAWLFPYTVDPLRSDVDGD